MLGIFEHSAFDVGGSKVRMHYHRRLMAQTPEILTRLVLIHVVMTDCFTWRLACKSVQ